MNIGSGGRIGRSAGARLNGQRFCRWDEGVDLDGGQVDTGRLLPGIPGNEHSVVSGIKVELFNASIRYLGDLGPLGRRFIEFIEGKDPGGVHDREIEILAVRGQPCVEPSQSLVRFRGEENWERAGVLQFPPFLQKAYQ